MKLLIDCSNLRAGGGIQVALSFLNDISKIKSSNKYVVILSPHISPLFDLSIYDSSIFKFLNIPDSYYNFFTKGRILRKIENKVKPDVIFCVFGPSYHKSDFPKIVGFAIPHLVYPDSPYFKTLSIFEKLNLRLLNTFKIYYFIKNSDALIFETLDAKNIFLNKYGKNIPGYVVNNTLNEIFIDKQRWSSRNFNIGNTFNILYLTAPYPHKNLNIIPSIIDEILFRDKSFRFKFVLSVNKNQLNFSDLYDPYIEYLGQVNIHDVPALYQQIDTLIMPSLLEVFSTSYLEAMFMKKPIIASDLAFSRYVCGDSAYYCSPLSATEYASAIFLIFNNLQLKEKLIKDGLKNLNRFGTSIDRTVNYLKILNNYNVLK